MIAGRIVIAIRADVLPRAEIEALGCMLLETDNPRLLLAHLKHALEREWPAHPPRDMAPPREREPEPPEFFDEPEPLLCRACRAEVTVSAGVGPHAARGDCSSCGVWRWIARAELQRASIDPATLPPRLADDGQLTLGGVTP